MLHFVQSGNLGAPREILVPFIRFDICGINKNCGHIIFLVLCLVFLIAFISLLTKILSLITLNSSSNLKQLIYFES